MAEGFDRLAYLAETDRQLNLPPGFSAAQIKVESNFNPNAVSPVGAVGLAQVMPNTLSSLNKREGGRNLDPRNEKDALQMHRELMQENLRRFGNPDDAARAYNGGWTPARWNNPETASYVKKIRANIGGSVTPTNQAGADLSPFLNDPNTAPLVAQAKADGFSDAEIASRLSAAVQSGAFKPQAQSSSLNMDAVGKSIASMATNNMSNAQIVGKLANDPSIGPLVLQATRDGFSDDDIVSRLGGQAFAPIAQARAKIAGQGALTNAGQNAANAIEEVGAGAQQIGARITGDDARLKALQQEQIARQQNPENQALNNTTAGKVGKYGTLAVPSVLAGVATGGASIPAQIAVQGAIGAAQGAFTPTTADGQFGENIAYGGVGGAVGGGAGVAAAAAPKVLGRAIQSGLRGGEDVATVAGRAAALEAEGITPTAAMLSPRAAAMSRTLEDNIPFAGSMGATKGAEAGEAATMKAITRRAGLESDTLDSNFVLAAEANNAKLYSQALDGVEVTLPQAQRQQIISSLERQIKDAPADIRAEIAGKFQNELAALKAGGNKIDAKTLQSIRSNIGGDGSALTLTPMQKGAYGKIYGELTDTLKNGLSKTQLEAFEAANKNYQHLQPIKKMVTSSGDSGTVTPRQLLQAIKTGKYKNDFVHGNAPYQDLADALGASAPRGQGNGVGKVASSALGATAFGGTAAAAPVVANGLVRALNNPALANALLGLKPAQRSAVLNAIMGAGVGAGGGIGGAVAGVSPVLSEEQQVDLASALGASAPGANLPKPTGKDLAQALKYRT